MMDDCGGPGRNGWVRVDGHLGRRGWQAVGAAAMLALVLPPQLLPHPLHVDILIGAAAALLGYFMASALLRGVSAMHLQRVPGRRVAPLLALGLLAVAGLRTRARVQGLRHEMGMPGNAFDATEHAARAVTGAVLAASAVLLAIALLRRLSWRHLALVAVLPVVAAALISARSGPADPNLKGTEFLDGARDAAAVSEATGRSAVTPHRIYIPVGTAPSHTGRAQAAVAATELAGGLNSAAVLLIIPTGSGWVNTRTARIVEDLYDGDLTTVAVQYGTTPSWQSYLRGGAGVHESAAELVRAMRARINQLPPAQRPQLLVYGESLGAWGLLPTLESNGSAVDAALLTGVPGDPRISSANTTVLNHPDDPVPGWKPWLAPAAFLRASADAIASEAVPIGHGHRYGAETTGAWCDLLDRPACA
ncbi:hypothetical protein GCM10027456_18380 [Kineosporia babensis]